MTLSLKTLMLFVGVYTASTFAMPFECHLNLPKTYRSKKVIREVMVDVNETVTFLDVKKPGCITHITFSMYHNIGRNVIVRMYWDGEKGPSVEAPLSDLCGIGHNNDPEVKPFATPCITNTPNHYGWNFYFPMPFRKSAKITYTNKSNLKTYLYIHLDYIEFDDLSDDVPYFHAQWTRANPALRRARPHTILQAVGEGFIVGMTYNLRIQDHTDSWYHGGGEAVFIDGRTKPYYLHGMGGEDYFSQCWGHNYNITDYAGCSYLDPNRISFYRFYLESPIQFKESIRFGFGSLADEIASVGYWYQKEPHHRFYKLPIASLMPTSPLEPGSCDIELLPELQLNAAVIGPFAGDINTKLTPEEKIDLAKPIKTNYDGAYKLGTENGMVQWESARTTLSWLDLNSFYRPKWAGKYKGRKNTLDSQLTNTVYYVYLRLHSNRKKTCKLLLGHDDPARVWLNNKKNVDLDNPAPENFRDFKGETIKLTLTKGWNDLLIKCTNNWNANFGANAISLHFPQTKGIKFDNFENLPSVPEYTPAP